MDTTTEEEREDRRKKRTLVLLVGGALSLLLPLLGVLYLKVTDSTAAANVSGSGIAFDRRDPREAPRLAPAGLPGAGVAAVKPGNGESSLGMVVPAEDLAREAQPQQQQAAPAPPPPPPAPEKSVAEIQPRQAPAKKEPKFFNRPSLQQSPFSTTSGKVGSGFAGRGGGKFAGGVNGPQAAPGAGGMPGGAPPGGMPDIGAMMQGAGAGGGAGGAPDVSQMLKGIPGMPADKK